MLKVFRLIAQAVAALALAAVLAGAPARGTEGPIPLATVKQAVNATAANWIAFRNFNGEQLLYFTQLVSWKCGLREIRYALNSSHISETWPLPDCDPQNPYYLDPASAQLYTGFPPGSVKFVSVQVVFSDGTETEVMTYMPCDGAGETSCAALMR